MNDGVPPLKLRQVLAEVFGIAPESLRQDSAINEVRGWDSVSHVEAIVALEATFRVTIPGSKIAALNTVALIQKELERLGVVCS